MSDPITAAILVSTVVGGATSAAGSIASGNAAARSGQYQAAVNEQNAKYAEFQSVDAIQRGRVQAQQVQRDVASSIASQKTQLAAMGQVLNLGTAGQITADTAQLGGLDVATVQANANKEALGFRIQAQNYRSGAALNIMEGNAAQTAGFLNAGGTLLGTIGKAGSQYYGMTRTSMKG